MRDARCPIRDRHTHTSPAPRPCPIPCSPAHGSSGSAPLPAAHSAGTRIAPGSRAGLMPDAGGLLAHTSAWRSKHVHGVGVQGTHRAAPQGCYLLRRWAPCPFPPAWPGAGGLTAGAGSPRCLSTLFLLQPAPGKGGCIWHLFLLSLPPLFPPWVEIPSPSPATPSWCPTPQAR